MSKTLEIESPCCASIRECNIRHKIIYSISQRKIIKRINAIRCNRYLPRRYTLKLDNIKENDLIIAEIYESNRGRLYIKIEYRPHNMNTEDAEKIIMEYFNPPEEIAEVVE